MVFPEIRNLKVKNYILGVRLSSMTSKMVRFISPSMPDSYTTLSVTDRIAYLNFVQGSLASNLAIKLDGARLSLKAVRDAETALAPRRESRSGLQLQITRLETHYQSGMEKRVAELKEQLRKAEAQDDQKEKEVELLKRKAVRESEQIKWDALREVKLRFRICVRRG